jgi:hypothetical protein
MSFIHNHFSHPPARFASGYKSRMAMAFRSFTRGFVGYAMTTWRSADHPR